MRVLQGKTAYLQLSLLLHHKVSGPAAPSIKRSPYFIGKQTEKANVSSQAKGKKKSKLEIHLEENSQII